MPVSGEAFRAEDPGPSVEGPIGVRQGGTLAASLAADLEEQSGSGAGQGGDHRCRGILQEAAGQTPTRLGARERGEQLPPGADPEADSGAGHEAADHPTGTGRRPPPGKRATGAVSLPAFHSSLFRGPALSSTEYAQCPIILCQDAVAQQRSPDGHSPGGLQPLTRIRKLRACSRAVAGKQSTTP